MEKLIKINTYLFLLVVTFLTSCKKEDSTGFLSPAIKYPNSSINASVGSGLIQSGAMAIDESTKPLEFSIEAIHIGDANGAIATKVMDYKVDTYFWQAEYTGKEVTNKELDAKRTKVNRPAIDINPENGNIVIYPEATDSLKLTKGKYVIDVKVKNSAEERIIKGAITINVTYSGPYYYKFAGVDGKLSDFTVTFKRLQETGNKITVYTLKKDGTPIDPKKLFGYDYGTAAAPDLKDWNHLGLSNPTKYTEFPDRLELEIAGFPLPFVAGQVLRIDMYNNGDANGAYFNYWFDMAIFKEGVWEVTIKLNYP
jgi:hypothetical protein